MVPPTDALPDLIDRVKPAIVQVDVLQEEGAGNGSGFFFRSDKGRAFVATNAHVVSLDADHFLDLEDGSHIPARINGIHPAIDVAVLEVDHEAPGILDFRGPGEIRAGETAVAIGSPHGLRGTVTAGIVSGLDRVRFGPGNVPTTMIQTDASIIWGNSGGPLIGLDGMVLGINSQIHIEQHGISSGICYAIPAYSARLACEAILGSKGIDVMRPTLGAPIRDLPYQFDAEERRKFGQRAGALVRADPGPDTPAAKAGLKKDDVIVRIDGIIVDDPGDIFTWLLDPACVHSDAQATVIRNGKTKQLKVRPTIDRRRT